MMSTWNSIYVHEYPIPKYQCIVLTKEKKTTDLNEEFSSEKRHGNMNNLLPEYVVNLIFKKSMKHTQNEAVRENNKRWITDRSDAK